MNKWKVLEKIVEIKSPWLEIIAERLLDDTGQSLDYWSIKKADSIVILPIWQEKILLPKKKYYRHGVRKMTYDFPGGRVQEGKSFQTTICSILEKEIRIKTQDILRLEKINAKPLYINTAFSDQKLHGYLVKIKSDVVLPDDFYFFDLSNNNSTKDISTFLKKISCLQCRMIFMEYMFNTKLM